VDGNRSDTNSACMKANTQWNAIDAPVGVAPPPNGEEGV